MSALREKKANNIEKAKKHLAQMKQYQQSIDEQYAQYPALKVKEAAPQQVQKVEQPQQPVIKQQSAQKQTEAATQPSQSAEPPASNEDDIEFEEELHDMDTMCAVSVIEAEMEIMKNLIKKSSGHEKDFYSDKLGNLEFQKSTIESNVQIGIITPDRYLLNLKKYQQDQETLYKSAKVQKLGSTNKHALRILKRVELIRLEISDMENPEEEEEQEQEEEAPQVAVVITSQKEEEKNQAIPDSQKAVP